MITSAPKPGQRTNEPPYKVTEITTYTQICIDAINKKLTKCFDFLFSGCGHQFNITVNKKTITRRAAGCPGHPTSVSSEGKRAIIINPS